MGNGVFKSDVKTDCFAYKSRTMCSALTDINCEGCHFYKPAGTECNTCSHKGTKDCHHCRELL